MDTAITLAAIPADPTLQNLQFSLDGQVLLATRSLLYILVPTRNRSRCIVNERSFVDSGPRRELRHVIYGENFDRNFWLVSDCHRRLRPSPVQLACRCPR